MRDDTGPDRTVRLSVPPRVEMVGVVRQVVGDLAALVPGLGSARSYDVRVVVSEAVTNAVEAHSRDGLDDPVDVTCRVFADRLVILIDDRAGGFDVTTIAPAAPDTVHPERERGRGLALIHSLCDDVSWAASASGTGVTLTVMAPPAAEAG